MTKEPKCKLDAGAIYDLYERYGLVPDHVSVLPKEEQHEAMQYYLNKSKGGTTI
jgi:hypothetical protein